MNYGYGIYYVIRGGRFAMFRILKCMSHRTNSRMLISFYFNVFIMYYLESVYKIIIIIIIPCERTEQ